MNERIKELLQRLLAARDENTPEAERQPLTVEELAELEAGVATATEDVEAVAAEQGDTLDTVAALDELAEAYEAITTEQGLRAAEVADIQRQAEERRAKIRALRGEEPETPETPEGETPEGEQPEQPAEGTEPAAETQTEPEPVAAAARPDWGTSVARVQAFRGERHTPKAPSDERQSPVVITAAAGLPNFGPGQSLTWDEIGDALHAAHWANAKGGGADGVDIPVAAIQNQADRASVKVSEGEKSDKLLLDILDAARAHGVSPHRPESVTAITAAGGLCGPEEVIYDWPTIGNARTPIGDSLPRMPATRGAVKYPTPYYWADVEGVTNGVVNDWSVANDVTALTDPNTRKVCARVLCPTWVTAQVGAVYSCIIFGNFAARFNPLVNDNFMREVPKVIARHAEAQRIAAIDAASLGGAGLGSTGRAFTYGSIFGTGHDVKNAFNILGTAYRQRYRMDPDAPLTVLTNEWLLRAVMEDMSRVLPGDDEFSEAADSYRQELFVNNALDATFSPDIDRFTIGAGVGAAGATGTNQYVTFPTTATAYIFPAGTFSILDGGRLDIGVVRDSALIQANDFEMFFEYWEKVIQTGFASWKVTLPISPKGSTSIAIANASPPW